MSLGIKECNINQVAAVFDQHMPEAFPGENVRRAHTLTRTTFGLDLESLKLVIFQLSNNFIGYDYDNPFETLRLCQALGVDQPNILTSLFTLAVHEPSIAAVLDRLFRDAFMVHETGLVSAMMRENTRYDRGQKYHIRPFPIETALLFVCSRSAEKRWRLKLPCNSNLVMIEVLLGPVHAPASPLANIFKNQLLELVASGDDYTSSLEMVEILLSRGANITSLALLSAISAGNEPLVRLMAAKGANFWFEMEEPISMEFRSYFVPVSNVLTAAVLRCCPTDRWKYCLYYPHPFSLPGASDGGRTGTLEEHRSKAELRALSMYRLILELLKGRTATGEGTSFSDFATSRALSQNALISAIYFGYNDLIRQLARYSDMNRANEFGVTPLQAAILSDNANTCRLILELGADPSLNSDPTEFGWCQICAYSFPRDPSHRCHQATPLALAIKNGSCEAAEVFLSSRILLRPSDFHLAILYGRFSVAKRMLEIGIDQSGLCHKSAAGDAPLQSILKQDGIYPADGKEREAYFYILDTLAGTNMNLCARRGDLSRAAKAGSRPLVIRLLKSLSPNDSDADGATALHNAFMNGHSEVVKVLIEYGATLPNEWLTYAFRYLPPTTILGLFKLGPDLSQYFRQKTSEGRGCLEMAILSNDETVVELAFACVPGYESGALCAALGLELPCKLTKFHPQWQHENELPGRIRELLKRRLIAGEDELDPVLENTAVGIAAYMKCDFLLTALLRYPHPHQQCFVPREWNDNTLSRMDIDLDGLYLPQTRFPVYFEFCGRAAVPIRGIQSSPLFMAVKSRDEKAIRSMLGAGYRPDALTLLSAIVAVHMREDFDDKYMISRQALIWLIERSPDLDARDAWSTTTPLNMAIYLRNVTLVQLLLGYGADVNSGYSGSIKPSLRPFGRNPRTPIQAAVEYAEAEDLETLFNLLLAKGADIHAPAYAIRGATALQLAAIGGKLVVARRLVKFGADVNAARAVVGGRTALEGAAEHGRLEAVQFLLNVGVSTTGTGRVQYLRALKFAVSKGHNAVADLLRKHREWDAEDDAIFDQFSSSLTFDDSLFIHPSEYSLSERRKWRRWALEQGYKFPDDPEVDEAEEKEEKMAILDFKVLFGSENADLELEVMAQSHYED